MRSLTEPLPETWFTRELLVLRHVVAEFDKERPHDMSVAEISMRMHVGGQNSFDVRLVKAALVALERDGLVTMQWVDGFGGSGRDLSESRVLDFDSRAYGLTGRWPSPEAAADRLLAALEDLAQHGSDADTRTKARKAVDALGSLSRDLFVSVAGAAAGVAMQ